MKIAYCGPISLSIVAPELLTEDRINDGYSYPFGAHFVNLLLELGHEVVVVTSAMCVDEVYEYREGKLSVYICPRRHPRKFVADAYSSERRYMIEALKSAKPDIVHAQWSYEFCHAARCSELPYVVTLRDAPWQVFWHTRSIYRLYRSLYAYWALWGVKNATAVSPYILESFSKYFFLKGAEVVPNALKGVALASQFDCQPNSVSPTILSVSAWNALKNCKMTFSSFYLIRKRYRAASLKLVGPGLEANGAAHQWAKKNKLDAGVQFAGKLAHGEVLRCMRNDADVLLYPSLEESFCMVVLEAMASGLPAVVLPRAGALPWLVDDGRAGAIAKDRSPSALAEAAISLLKDECYYNSIRENALQRVKKHFTMKSVVESYLNVYGKVLGNA